MASVIKKVVLRERSAQEGIKKKRIVNRSGRKRKKTSRISRKWLISDNPSGYDKERDIERGKGERNKMGKKMDEHLIW